MLLRITPTAWHSAVTTFIALITFQLTRKSGNQEDEEKVAKNDRQTHVLLFV